MKAAGNIKCILTIVTCYMRHNWPPLVFKCNVILFHELQSQAGGFLGDSLYLLHSSAVVGVATVGVNSCKLHALCLSDGLSQSEGLRI